MNNPEFMNTNNNELSMNGTDNCISNGEDCNFDAQQNTNCVKNSKENSDVSMFLKENYSKKKFFKFGKSKNSLNENSSNILSKSGIFANGSNENPPTNNQREDELSELKCHQDYQHNTNIEASKATDEQISFAKGNIATGDIRSDNKSYFSNRSSPNDECLPSVQSDEKSPDVHCNMNPEVQLDKPQSVSSNFNIVPNPNEFNLVGESKLSLQNPDFPSLNQSANEILAFSDNSIVISNSNAIPQSDSIVSSNYSLSQLQQYISDDEDDSVAEELPAAPLQYRENDQQMEDSDDDSDSSTSSSTSILISDSSSDSESGDEYENFNTKPVCIPIKAKGEMDLNDLPPIEELTISVPEEECTPVGKVYQVVDQLVIIRANKDTPAYDLDTVFFTQGGKPLGKVFDVMGPVTEPYYCIRFNSKDQIKAQNITLDQTVYAAPKTQHSKFVFLAQLMQLKGSDASWENDVEPPEIYLDYSDDEQEQRAKKKFHRNKKAVFKTDSDSDEPARKRHSAYVKRMNARNLKLSAVRSNQNPKKSGNAAWQPNLPLMIGRSPPRPMAPCNQMSWRSPLFDMRVPSPSSSFSSHTGPQFHRHEFSVYPQVFTGPSTSSCAPGPTPLPRLSTSPGPPPFPRPCTSQGFSNGHGMRPFSPTPPYCQLPRSQAQQTLPRNPGIWNPVPNNPWAGLFTPRNIPPPLRNTPPPPVSTLPFSMDFPGSFLNRPNSPRGPHFNMLPPWPTQPNPRGNSPQFNFNPSVPPPSPNFFKN